MGRLRLRARAGLSAAISYLCLGALWLLSKTPLAVLRATGRLAGRVFAWLNPALLEAIEENVAFCFPQKTPTERSLVARRCVENLFVGLCEKGIVWYGSASRSYGNVHGVENLEAARQGGRGVILLGFHFSDLELALRVLSERAPICIMYFRDANPVFEEAAKKGRGRHCTTIERSSVRTAIRALGDGAAIWYAPDQEYSDPRFVTTQFFGQPIRSITATSRLVRVTGAAVVPFLHSRTADGIRVELLPALDGFGEDEVADAQRINQLLEAAIIAQPESYLWMNRRLNRAEGSPAAD